MNIIKLLRVHQYVKNIFVFAPIFFVGELTNTTSLLTSMYAFVAFCCIASAVYVLNDYLDIKNDQAHPRKKFRPLAAGDVSIKCAVALMIILLLCAETIAFFISLDTFFIINFYLLINIAYCFGFKNIGLLDVIIIATGFVIRLFVGSSAIEVDLSNWIVIMTFLLALFLALAKRRDDVLIYESTGERMRPVIKYYNLKFLDSAISIMVAVIIVAYMSYTTSPDILSRIDSDMLFCSLVFVILGLLRYLQLTLVMNNSGSPTRLVLSDHFLQITIACWLLFFTYVLYT